MKSIIPVAATLLLFAAGPASSQVLFSWPEQTVEKGPHHDAIEQPQEWLTPEGEALLVTNRYTAMASGLNFWDAEAQAWKSSRPEWEIVGNTVVSRHGQYQVILGGNFNSGAEALVDLKTPDNLRLRARCLGLAFTDYASGQSVLIAEPKDSTAFVLPPQEVYFLDCMDGGFVVDARYRYDKGAFHADLILREALPTTPADWGLDPATTWLEVWTDWLTPPQPVIRQIVLRDEPNPAWPDFVDENLAFGGVMEMGTGRLFKFEEESPLDLPVAKTWIQAQADQRSFLVERVEFSSIAPYLDQLPRPTAKVERRVKPEQSLPANPRMLARNFPPLPTENTSRRQPSLLAAQDLKDKGLVWDWELAVTMSNVTFRGDSVYVVLDTAYLSQTTRLECATIRFTNYTAATAKIVLKGPLECLTSGYKPAVFSAIDDSSVGGAIGSGTLSGYYATKALEFDYNGQPFDLHDIRIRYAKTALALVGGSRVTLRQAQIGKSELAFFTATGTTFDFGNILVFEGVKAFSSAITNHGNHATFHNLSSGLITGPPGNALRLTNSLISGVTNNMPFLGEKVETNVPDSAFKIVGEGAHYLAGYTYRNRGITNLPTELAQALRERTTFAPTVLTNNFTSPTKLGARAWRDNDAAYDLGFHYMPLDAVVRDLIVSNAPLVLTNGVAIGVYGPSSSFGFHIKTGGAIYSQGEPAALNRLVRYSAVQEQANTNWSDSTVGALVKVSTVSTPKPIGSFRFTEWAQPGGTGSHFDLYLSSGSITTPFAFRDCLFGPGRFYLEGAAVALTNSLFERVVIELYDANHTLNRYFYNNLFWKCSLDLEAETVNTWFAYDNLFDQSTINVGMEDLVHNRNGYVTNFTRLYPNGANDQVLTNVPVYLKGPLGNWYYPTNDGLLSTLIDVGSRNATNAGLYYYTVATNLEATTTVDIGFHFAGVSNGIPVDSDLDGLWNGFEDRNGNGAPDDQFNPTDPDTNDDGLNDRQNYELSENVLVNDPAQDNGNEKNSQSETTVIGFDNRIIVAYVDTNRGATGYGSSNLACLLPGGPPFTNRNCMPSNTVAFIGWSLSPDGGVSFQDMDTLPHLQPGTNGNAGDPVLARDTTLGITYLIGNPQRGPTLYFPTNGVTNLYAPLWRWTDGGETFLDPINVAAGLLPGDNTDYLDKPTLVVDNFPGAGNGNLFAAFYQDSSAKLVICGSSAGGTNWQVIQSQLGTDVFGPFLTITPAHEVCLVWRQPNGFYFTKATSPWTNFPAPSSVAVAFTNTTGEAFQLFRSNSAHTNDYLNSGILASLVANPVVTNHLYMVYHDAASSGITNPNIYFVQSTNAGLTWTNRIQVNTNTNQTDQWQPAITVHPDGTKLFIAWYDRRDDPTSNSLIRTYGVFANLPVTNSASFANNFPISSVQFPLVVTGTNDVPGTFDPIYYPKVSSPFDDLCCESFSGTYRNFAGNDYDIAMSDRNYVYYTWSDNRLTCTCTNGVTRNQPDVRFIKVSWPP